MAVTSILIAQHLHEKGLTAQLSQKITSSSNARALLLHLILGFVLRDLSGGDVFFNQIMTS